MDLCEKQRKGQMILSSNKFYVFIYYMKQTKSKKRFRFRNTQKQKKKGGGDKSYSFDSFQSTGKEVDDFFTLFDIDRLSYKDPNEYLGYKKYNRNSKFKFYLTPSYTRKNQYSGLKVVNTVLLDPGLGLFDELKYQFDKANNDFAQLMNGYYNVTGKSPKRKGTFVKEIDIKEKLKDNLPPVEEENITSFVNKRFK